eukprot:TRINITY_DN1514_c0_g1_i2.p1 TRINITY_DN1514_c0_g1~~TRINITY_DN1514_c0_g1_i2.p1  ORF type:complete len:1383 (-),score=192.52 TRINITY_DN1514_c0_g1_i2:30-4178(-)
MSVWENQRFYPIKGWSSKLLPSDRYKWSSQDGKTKHKKVKSDPNWQVVVNENTDPEGWVYSFDFPDAHAWNKIRHIKHMVRRREWRAKVEGLAPPIHEGGSDSEEEQSPLHRPRAAAEPMASGGHTVQVPVVEVKVIRATELMRTDVIGGADPYVCLRIRYPNVTPEAFRQTTVKKGTHPEWNEQFQFALHNPGPAELEVSVFDRDRKGPELMGQGSIPIAGIPTGQWFDRDVPLRLLKNGEWVAPKGKSSTLHIALRINTSGGRPPLPGSRSPSVSSTAPASPSPDPLGREPLPIRPIIPESSPEREPQASSTPVQRQIQPETLASPPQRVIPPLEPEHTEPQNRPASVERETTLSVQEAPPRSATPRVVSPDVPTTLTAASSDEPAPPGAKAQVVLSGLSALALRAADSKPFGQDSSDPYLSISLHSPSGDLVEQKKTSVVKNSLSPKWEESISFANVAQGSFMRIEVFDWDKVGSHDHLGTTMLEIPSNSGSKKEILVLGGHPKATGSVNVTIATNYSTTGSSSSSTAEVDSPKTPVKRKPEPLADEPRSIYPANKLSCQSFLQQSPVLSSRAPVGAVPDINRGQLIIFSVSAEGLRAADNNILSGKSSDPYAEFTVKSSRGEVSQKTTKKMKELSPNWANEIFKFDLFEKGCDLIIRVFDWDRAGSDDLLGETTLALPPEDGFQHLTMKLTGHKAQGTISFGYGLCHDPEGDPLVIQVTLKSATDVRSNDANGEADPYVKFFLGNIAQNSKVVKNTTNPVWNETFRFVVLPLGESRLEIKLKDKDLLGNDILGLGDVDLASLPWATEAVHAVQVPTNNKGKPSGTVHLVIKSIVSPAIAKWAAGLAARSDLDQAEQRGREAVMHEEAMERDRASRPPGSGSVAGAFGRLVVTNMSCQNLLACDKNLVRGASSDPFLKVTVFSYQGHQDQSTTVKQRCLNPIWAGERMEFPLFERGCEVLLQVYDWDRLSQSDLIGEYSFIVPDTKTEATHTVTLTKCGRKRKDTTSGTLTFSYMVDFDEQEELWGCFRTYVSRGRREKKAKGPPFSPTITLQCLKRLTTYLWPMLTALNVVMDTYKWVDKQRSAIVFTVLLVVCIKSWFFQAFCFSLVYGMGYAYAKRFNKYRTFFGLDKAAAERPVSQVAEEQTASLLGWLTSLLFLTCNIIDMVIDLFTWRYPQRTKPVFYCAVALFLGSWVLPVWFCVMWGVLYLFVLEALYSRYPIFRARFPPQRLPFWALEKAKARLGIKSKPNPPFAGELVLEILEAQDLIDTDKAGKSDPFIVVALGDQRRATLVQEGTLNPKWHNEKFRIPMRFRDEVVRLQVWDFDELSNDFMGETSVYLSGVCKPVDTWLSLGPRKGHSDHGLFITGTVHVRYFVEKK